MKKLENLEKVDYKKIVEISQKLFGRIKKLDPKKVVLLGKGSVKLIAGCLPFRSKANADRFREFVRPSLRV